MWCILSPIIGVVLFSFSSARGGLQSPENWPTALIHHQRAAHDYALKMEANSDCACLKKFTTLEMDERKNACLNYLVNAISFSIPPDNRDYVRDDFASLVRDTFEKAPTIYFESLPYKSVDGEHQTPAQVCIAGNGLESWALSAGLQEGVSLVFKESRSSKFDLFGLLEEMPNIEPGLSQTQLEKLYETGEREFADTELKSSSGEKNIRSLCDLNDYERFRLCAVGYLAREHSKTESPNYQQGNHIQMGPPRCIKSHIVIEKRDAPQSESSLAADIITCPINVESKDAELFFANDPHTADSMFSVEPQWKRAALCAAATNKGGISGTGFNLEFHMRNVRVLQPICATC